MLSGRLVVNDSLDDQDEKDARLGWKRVNPSGRRRREREDEEELWVATFLESDTRENGVAVEDEEEEEDILEKSLVQDAVKSDRNENKTS